jgi:hypothetical protein
VLHAGAIGCLAERSAADEPITAVRTPAPGQRRVAARAVQTHATCRAGSAARRKDKAR